MTTSGGTVSVGRRVYINKFLMIDGLGDITIEDDARIGPACKLITSTHEITRNPQARASRETAHVPIVIERGAWLCAGTVVLPGVTIREGCVIAAGAVVTKTTQPNGLYAGIPAVRKRDLPV